MWFSRFFFLILSVIVEVYLWWQLQASLIFLRGRTCTIGGWLNTFCPTVDNKMPTRTIWVDRCILFFAMSLCASQDPTHSHTLTHTLTSSFSHTHTLCAHIFILTLHTHTPTHIQSSCTLLLLFLSYILTPSHLTPIHIDFYHSSGSRGAQRSKALYLNARGVTTDPGLIPGCITTGRDWASHRRAHNWPSVMWVRVGRGRPSM